MEIGRGKRTQANSRTYSLSYYVYGPLGHKQRTAIRDGDGAFRARIAGGGRIADSSRSRSSSRATASTARGIRLFHPPGLSYDPHLPGKATETGISHDVRPAEKQKVDTWQAEQVPTWLCAPWS